MKILINDFVQDSDAPDDLKSPSLSDYYEDLTSFDIDFGENKTCDCIGFGYTDATTVNVTTVSGLDKDITVDGSGLYEFPSTTDDIFTVSHDGSYIGRVALGLARSLGVAPTREAGFYTTAEPRVTASGQVIPGAGGYYGKRLSVDFRYKIDEDIFDDIEAAFEYISQGYPWFMLFSTKEQERLPWARMYASPDDPEMLLQSSVNRFLYSRQFDFFERF